MAEEVNEKEGQFIQWMEQDSRRREIRRLKERLGQLEKLQLASYFGIFFWVSVMFVGYQLRPDLVRADLAGIVTAVTMFGGAFIVWHVLRLKRETQRRIEAEQVGLEDKT